MFRPTTTTTAGQGLRAVLVTASVLLVACSPATKSATQPAPNGGSGATVPATTAGVETTAPGEPPSNATPSSAPSQPGPQPQPLPTLDLPPRTPPPASPRPVELDDSPHPLDGLTAEELDIVRATLIDAGHIGADAVFPVIDLRQPAKQDVRAWTPGSSFERRVDAVVVTADGTFSTTVNVRSQVVESWESASNTRYAFVSGDFSHIATVTADPRFVAGLERRGITRPQALCVGFGPGPARSEAERGRRLLRVGCYQRGETNFWSQPVEGLIGTFDLDNRTVIDIIDEDPVPIPAPGQAMSETEPPTVEPADADPTIIVAGSAVRWNEWDLRWKMDRRLGLVIHSVAFQPDEERGSLSVLHEAYLSEMYVPYQDPSAAWAWRTFMDSGEFGMGNTLSSLIPGVDCPPDAHLIDATMADQGGSSRTVERGICLFVRAPSAPVWRHDRNGSAGEELVVRNVSTVGNYDYVIDYVFRRDGSIRVDVAAAGVVLQKAVAAQTVQDHHASGGDAFGTLVAPGLVGVNHDHFLNFRLDLDVLGVDNRFVREQLLPAPVDGDASRTSIWERHAAVQSTEGGFGVPTMGDERWLIDAGDGQAYRIDRGNAVADPITDRADPGLARAAWATMPLWVTPNSSVERFAGGEFVLGSTGLDDGLAVWADAGRPIVDEDLVAWLTVGFHHVVRSEDLPIMPTHSASFSLVPENVFAANPFLTN